MDNHPKQSNLRRLTPAIVYITAVLFIGMALGNLLWLCASDILAFGRPNNTVELTVEHEDNLQTLSQKLFQQGLIKYPGLFKLYASATSAMDTIRPGTYTLNTLYDYPALVDTLSSAPSSRLTVTVTIPEGYTCNQIFSLLEAKGVCPKAKLEQAVAQFDGSDYWFLENVPMGSANALEGYLFPDTYSFYEQDNPQRVLNKLLTAFDARFPKSTAEQLVVLNEALSAKMDENGLTQTQIDQRQLTLHKIVTIASMIEKESANSAESSHIASVIYNRLTNPGVYPRLNIDATLVYITGNTTITDADKKIDSPYNTYLYPGLIPGPIASPGKSSLQAALQPENTDFYFYALNPETGAHHFTKTYAEHLAFLDTIKE